MLRRLSDPETIYYDASCGLCSASMRSIARIVERRGVTFQPLQDPQAVRLLGLADGEVPDEIKLRTSDGRILSGFDAILYVTRRIWWAKPLCVLGQVPVISSLARRSYRFITRNRYGISRACGLTPQRSLFSILISLITEITVIVVMILAAAAPIRSWLQMWLLALGVWTLCKLHVWRNATQPTSHTTAATFRFFLWPGMDASPFLRRSPTSPTTSRDDWTFALARVAFGSSLLWFVARHVASRSVVLAGWIGMIGCVLLLHFGLFHLIALTWRARGVGVEPIMRRPLAARSITDFWTRWNHGFRDFAFSIIFRPLHRRLGLIGATYVTFLFSGLVHDLVISLPARAGFGLPTLYFLFQGAGVLIERSPILRCLHPIVRRLFMYVILIAPLPLLFHTAFVVRVFVPFMHAVRAL